jgi:replication-associated recombination protein RarA
MKDVQKQLLKKIKITTLDDLTIDKVNKLLDKQIINKDKIKNTKKVKKNKVILDKTIDKTTDKYKIALKLVNKILVNIGKEEVDDLCKFQTIDRIDILNDANKADFEKMSDNIYKLFDKVKCSYYHKKENRVLNCLKYMCKDIGLTFSSQRRNIQINSINKTHIFYSIF